MPYVTIFVSDKGVDMPDVDRGVLRQACQALGWGLSNETTGLVNARKETSVVTARRKLRAELKRQLKAA